MPWIKVDALLDCSPKMKAIGFESSAVVQGIWRIAKLFGSRGTLSGSWARPEAIAGHIGCSPALASSAISNAARVGLLVVSDTEISVPLEAWSGWQEDPSATDRQRAKRERDAKVAESQHVTDVTRDRRDVTDVTGRDVTGRDVTVEQHPPRKERAAPRTTDTKDRARANGVHAELLALYRAEFERLYQAKAVVTAADKAQLGRLLAKPPEGYDGPAWVDVLRRAIPAFVADGDAWLAKNGHALRHLGGRINAYIAVQAKGGDTWLY